MSGKANRRGKLRQQISLGNSVLQKNHRRKTVFWLTLICPFSFFFFNLISEAGYRAEQRPGKWQPRCWASAAAKLMEYLGQCAAILCRWLRSAEPKANLGSRAKGSFCNWRDVKSAAPFKQHLQEGSPCCSPHQLELTPWLRSPIPAQQSTGWEISVAMGFGYKRPKDVDVNQVSRYRGRAFSALKLNLMWKLFSKKQHFVF